MSAADTSKLTKKQKKSIAFRDRKGKGKRAEHDEAILDVPVSEDQDLAEVEGDTATAENDQGDSGPLAKKRKRVQGEDRSTGANKSEGEDVGDEKRKKKRKIKAATEGAGAGVAAETEEQEENVNSKTNSKQRFILFVGNLKYTTPKNAIEEHFAACDPPPTIRLLTQKQQRAGATVAKSKGCAFLEFTSKNSLQQALKLHHSTLDSRQINVELTAGGGGKSETRLSKLRERNKELAAQRTKKLQKAVADGQEVRPDRPQRFSATSGEGEAPLAKRTWTVGEEEDENTHRGGKKHKKTRGAKVKPWGTGVNAIPVG
ncbi:hypothetical protein HETIRDRAFT_306110 [Heterobasidion irregulare TC 32-1]|uniref:RRM domain-containing protein n=1 Tax=Heterobasidion irregulare (strain TC 32-1) TaxID=747525 RepID=W4KN03_HETIT|nr:uncharacterized protein HETIRDRAFT_306110 [Heterobasidion irregulare TC 32-1]ETW87089.1 hypothetical protein HETIRDRAFT_306110 [Heterobasidion irregulare TC 32-1]